MLKTNKSASLFVPSEEQLKKLDSNLLRFVKLFRANPIDMTPEIVSSAKKILSDRIDLVIKNMPISQYAPISKEERNGYYAWMHKHMEGVNNASSLQIIAASILQNIRQKITDESVLLASAKLRTLIAEKSIGEFFSLVQSGPKCTVFRLKDENKKNTGVVMPSLVRRTYVSGVYVKSGDKRPVIKFCKRIRVQFGFKNNEEFLNYLLAYKTKNNGKTPTMDEFRDFLATAKAKTK